MNAAHNADRPDLVMLVTRALVLYSIAEFQGGHVSTIDVLGEATSFGRGHAITRTINGLPYLPFIYTHLDYPFGDADPPGQVQLQGIGMSLVNATCSELSVVVRKSHGTLRLSYEFGVLCREERDEITNESTGTSVSGTVNPLLAPAPADVGALKQWLSRVASTHPGLNLKLNGERLLFARAG
jgi:DNA gyrase/topoisomerase IV subunit B